MTRFRATRQLLVTGLALLPLCCAAAEPALLRGMAASVVSQAHGLVRQRRLTEGLGQRLQLALQRHR